MPAATETSAAEARDSAVGGMRAAGGRFGLVFVVGLCCPHKGRRCTACGIQRPPGLHAKPAGSSDRPCAFGLRCRRGD